MKRRTRYLLIAIGLMAVVGLAGVAQTSPLADADPAAPRVLLIDETRTFTSTMRVGALAGALRQGGVTLDVRLETVSTSYVDPLADSAAPDEPFDLILIVPIGSEDGSVSEVWLLASNAATESAEALDRIALLRGLLSAVFEGVAVPSGATDDLWIAGLAAVYETQGWLR